MNKIVLEIDMKEFQGKKANDSIKKITKDGFEISDRNEMISTALTEDAKLLNLSSEANETVVAYEKEKAHINLEMEIQKAWNHYQQTVDLYQHFQKNLIPNANKIAMIANLSFKEGQISYIEWSNSMTQVQSIKMQALETLKLFNLNQSTLNYLLSK